MPHPESAGAAPVARVARWLVPSASGLGVLFVVVFMFAMQFRFLADSDTGWHIRTGDLIRLSGHAPVADPFSFTMQGQEWFAWEWLSDWVMSHVHQRFGLNGVVAVFFSVLAAAYGVLQQVMRRRGVDSTLALTVLCASALCSAVHWLARPHLFSVLFIVIWSVLVEAYRRRRSPAIWWVPALVVVWANLHAAFVIAIAMLGVYAAGEWVEAAARGGAWSRQTRRMLGTYASVAALSVAAGLGTPYGIRLYTHIVGYLGDAALLAQINEFQSPNFHSIDGRLTELLMGAAVVAAIQAVRRGRWVEPILVAMWVHLSLQSARHLTLAAVVLAPILAEQWHDALRELAVVTGADRAVGGLLGRLRRLHAGVAAIDHQVNNGALYVGLAVFFVVLVGNTGLRNRLLANDFPASQPVAAARFIERERAAGRLQGHVFAPDQFGGYLIYRFEGRLKVFYDGRSDFYNQGPTLGDSLSIGLVGPRWAELLDRYAIDWMLLRRNMPLAVTAVATGAWTPIYEDATAQVLVRRPNNPVSRPDSPAAPR